MKAEDFGKMIKKFFRSLRKNFIDIKFLSISILVLLFASLLVFKPKRGFLEGHEIAKLRKRFLIIQHTQDPIRKTKHKNKN